MKLQWSCKHIYYHSSNKTARNWFVRKEENEIIMIWGWKDLLNINLSIWLLETIFQLLKPVYSIQSQGHLFKVRVMHIPNKMKNMNPLSINRLLYIHIILSLPLSLFLSLSLSLSQRKINLFNWMITLVICFIPDAYRWVYCFIILCERCKRYTAELKNFVSSLQFPVKIWNKP